MRNLICRALEIPIVIIQMGITGLKKSGLVYLLDLFVGRGEESGVLLCV